MSALPSILSHVHCIGFDMDHTIVRYNLPNLFKLVYNSLRSYLVEHEKFYAEFAQCEMRPEFAAKGLVLDLVKGNCLKVDENKVIVKGVHGFTPLTKEQIKELYPEPLHDYTGHRTERFLAVVSYFEAPICSLFLHAVELCEKHGKTNFMDVIVSLGKGFEHYFGKFPNGGYFQAIIDNPQDYLYKASPSFIAWLQALKQKGVKVALITNSFAEYTHLLMNFCYGEQFHDLFDVVVVQAIKPNFFTKQEPFLEFENYFPEANTTKLVQDLKLHRKPLPLFSKGNVYHLIESLERVYQDEHKENPERKDDKIKFCYVGDNMIGDVVVPKAELQWTTIAIVEELDHLYHTAETSEKGANYSEHWGSFFYHSTNDNEQFHTFYSRLLRESADYCCFSVDDLIDVAEHDLDKSSLSPCVVLKPKL